MGSRVFGTVWSTWTGQAGVLRRVGLALPGSLWVFFCVSYETCRAMKADELRESFLSFFESKGCVRCPSDVLVPTWDPSVLFTPAGMNPFKDHFLGRVKLEFTRACSCQKCLRTADIDNVGRTPYHHTFFEMLGNFSFGDYFKREAIHWAWEYLTSSRWLGLSPEVLSVSVYLEDDEAYEIWHREIGLPPEKIQRLGEDENFWPAGAPTKGPDGVCGPCSEIFFHTPRGEAVEIWNLVFTQFNRIGPPPNNLHPLPKKNIDTGMGLERMASVLQGVDSNFHIDILYPIVLAAAEVCGVKYEPESEAGRRLRRITDHIRACTFAIHENVYPGPNKEKYVIRRLLRRAVLDGHHLGMREPFLYKLVPVVVEMMKVPYPELQETQQRVAQVVRQEEANFFATIDAGLERIYRVFDELQKSGKVMVPGEDIYYMYTTHGFPPELFEQMAAERNFTFDWEGFRRRLEADDQGVQVEIFSSGPLDALKRTIHTTRFLGYETTKAPARVVGIIAQNHLVDQLTEQGHQDPVTVVLDQSPFYGEAGGQVGDTGRIYNDQMEFEVIDTQRSGDLILHLGHLRRGILQQGQQVTAEVDAKRRQGIRRAHSATHILHYALQKHLGRHAQQQGSKVDEDWLRFDFTNLEPVPPEKLEQIEEEVRQRIAEGAPIRAQIMPLAQARKQGAMMLFGEKYPDPVRVIIMGQFSKELCGGTHLENTAQVEAFELISEESVAAGVRRVVALTGPKARAFVQQSRELLGKLCRSLGVGAQQVAARVEELVRRVRRVRKALEQGMARPEEAKLPPAPKSETLSLEEMPAREIRRQLQRAARAVNVAPEQLPQRVEQLLEELKQLEAQAREQAQRKTVSADDLLAEAQKLGQVRVVVAEVPGATAAVMRQLIDQLRQKAAPVAVLLASRDSGKVTLVAGLSRDLVQEGLDAAWWIRQVAPLVGGGGGGKPLLAQAGGKLPDQLPQALEKAQQVLAQMLQQSQSPAEQDGT